MKAQVYLENGFLNRIEELQKFMTSTSDIFESDTHENAFRNILKLKNIFKLAQFNVLFNKKHIIKLHQKLSGGKSPESFEELVLIRALRSSNLNLVEEIDFRQGGAIYFLNCASSEAHKHTTEKNILCLGNDYDLNTSFSPASIVLEAVDSQMNGIEYMKHRCRNVVIIDPYLFKDDENKIPKIPNVVKFLMNLYLKNESCPCHLTIICRNLENNNLFESKIKEIVEGLGNTNLKVSVLAYYKTKEPFGNNRYFITDYCSGEYQHLFDRDAHISASFFYDVNDLQGTERCYHNTNELLRKVKTIYNKESEMIGTIKVKFGNILDNPLFNDLD